MWKGLNTRISFIVRMVKTNGILSESGTTYLWKVQMQGSGFKAGLLEKLCGIMCRLRRWQESQYDQDRYFIQKDKFAMVSCKDCLWEESFSVECVSIL